MTTDAIEEFKKRQEKADAEMEAARSILLEELEALKKRIAEINVLLAKYDYGANPRPKRRKIDEYVETVRAFLTQNKEASRAEIQALLGLGNVEEIMSQMQRQGWVKKKRGYGGKYYLVKNEENLARRLRELEQSK